MLNAEKGQAQNLDGAQLRVGIVQARFNESITNSLTQACREELLALGVQAGNIDHVTVPGALEVPVALQAMAESDRYDALVALGCIIRGETYHFELVANESGAGVTRLALDYQLPIANAIITTENTEQAIARQTEKGRDAARVAVEMANLLQTIARTLSDEQSTPASGRPPRQSRGGLTSTGARKAASKSNRSRAREFALQALYQHLVGGNDVEAIDRFTRDLSGFHKADSVHYDALLRGCINSQVDLDALIAPKLDRTMAEISPIEHASMWIGVYEFQHCPDVPWRVVLNECIELAKEFGGTDGHKYVNAVLNGLAPTLRAAEVEHDRAGKGSAPAQPAAKADTATDAAADAATDAAADDAADQAAG